MTMRLLIFLFLIISLRSIGQFTAGTFQYKHYSVKDYKTHPLNFDAVKTGDDGLMYFANAYGVLQFDGKSWKQMGLPNGNAAIKLFANKKGEVYVGSYAEFGYLKRLENGSLSYSSLSSALSQEELPKGPILEILATDSIVYFLTREALYSYSSQKVNVAKVAQNLTSFSYLGKKNEEVYLLTSEGKRIVIADSTFNEQDAFYPFSEDVIFVYDYKGKSVVVTSGHCYVESGKYNFDTITIPNLKDSNLKITAASFINEHELLLSIKSEGLVFYNFETKHWKWITEEDGLPSLGVNDIFVDEQGIVWLSSDNGILQFWMNSPFAFINIANGVTGSGLAAAVYGDSIYLGTTDGLFSMKYNGAEAFVSEKAVKLLRAKVTDIHLGINELVCTTTEGVYTKKNSGFTKISNPLIGHGNWKFELLKNQPNYAIKGTYEGIHLYQKINGIWNFKGKLEGFDESARVFKQDEDGFLWVCHGNKGLFKMHINIERCKVEDVLNYNVKQNLDPTFFNSVDIVNNELLFSGHGGIYTYDKTKDQILKHDLLNSFFPEDRYINKLFSGQNGDVFVFSANDLLVLKSKGSSIFEYKEDLFSILNSKFNGSYEFFTDIDTNYNLIGLNEGFVLSSMNRFDDKSLSNKLLVRQLNYTNGSSEGKFFSTFEMDNASKYLLPYDFSNLSIDFILPNYDLDENINYQYSLQKEGQENIWSNWFVNNTINIASIKPGDYTLKLRAKKGNSTNNIASFTIHILVESPWFLSKGAYFIYLFLFLGFLYLIYRYVLFLFKRQKRQLEYKRNFELAEADKKLLTLQNDKLESEMRLKNDELASYAIAVKQKDNVLNQLKKEVKSINLTESTAESDFQLKKVLATIDGNLNFDDSWDLFQKNYDLVYNNFLQELRAEYPRLNTNWLLFCAYIRMNKTNKEIAELMNISVGAVEKRKYRMHEKFNKNSYQELLDFFFNKINN